MDFDKRGPIKTKQPAGRMVGWLAGLVTAVNKYTGDLVLPHNHHHSPNCHRNNIFHFSRLTGLFLVFTLKNKMSFSILITNVV
ncbi:hypothetical protein T4D_1382 [Trichinella pseudospiralis]|uniref:Uncharacterized protein n=1 Tax=Trichinella pseudospiralis TaxID=6337 RepID=A0A0V1FF55_TRIPS|nr:hypothetical protein T4D_14370 [Trichinella pseudospiralis]KRY84694.1 hypothetical protein T4D_1382 [Trichinella pseudospiralis]